MKTLHMAVVTIAVAALTLSACSSTKPPEKSPKETSGAPAVSSGTVPASAPGAATSGSPDGTTPAATPGATSAADSATGPTKAKKEYNLQFIQGVQGDEFYISMQCGMEAEAATLGVKVTTQGPQKFDPTLQKPILDSVISAKPDAILIAPTDVKAMQEPLKNAARQGIKVVLVDTTTVDPSFAVSQIASDNSGGGKAAFDEMKQLVPGGGKVLVISTDPGVSTADARSAGFEAAAKEDPAFQFLGVQYSHDDPATAAQLVTAALQKDPDIVGIFAVNLFAAEGSATGVKQAGKQGHVRIVAFDAGPNQVKALQEDTVQALIAQQPAVIGADAIQQAVAALDGGTVTATIQTGSSVITKDNVEGNEAIYKSQC